MNNNPTRCAWDSSIIVRLTRRAAAGSLVLSGARYAIARVHNSANVVTTASLPSALERAVERSTIVGLEREAESIVRASFVCRWFTTEPEQDPILIDLRDTYSVGPIIALFDLLHELFGPVWQSGSAESVREIHNTLVGATARSRTGRALVKLFAPPDPPGERHDRE